MLKVALISALLAGLYGALHDQVTFTISSEYFLNLKYQQFQYLNFNLNDRIRVSIIGFLATWWVGLFFGWFLARWYLPHCSETVANKKIIKSGFTILVMSVLFATTGSGFVFLKGESIDHSSWLAITNAYDIQNISAFIHVAYIHNCSYAGALFGFVIALLLVKRNRPL